MAATQDDVNTVREALKKLPTNGIALAALDALEERLEEIRVLAHKTLYGPDPEPSIRAMQEVLRLAE